MTLISFIIIQMYYFDTRVLLLITSVEIETFLCSKIRRSFIHSDFKQFYPLCVSYSYCCKILINESLLNSKQPKKGCVLCGNLVSCIDYQKKGGYALFNERIISFNRGLYVVCIPRGLLMCKEMPFDAEGYTSTISLNLCNESYFTKWQSKV